MTNEIPYIQEADEFQAWALKTMSGDYAAIGGRIAETMPPLIRGGKDWLFSQKKMTDLLHAGMGICTEGGEFFDPIKKHIMYGKELDTDNMREELGDLLWYIAIAAEALGTNLSDIMTENIRKLAKRYPDQIFTEHAAKKRADKNGL
jgi:NTP pyrophosphatase (non-canonical NTP hydrolase)